MVLSLAAKYITIEMMEDFSKDQVLVGVFLVRLGIFTVLALFIYCN
jgi:hypothetical protein